jgi:hypothetical protein
VFDTATYIGFVSTSELSGINGPLLGGLETKRLATGIVHVTTVDEIHRTLDDGSTCPPAMHANVSVLTKLVPVRVTTLPPSTGPVLGWMATTVGLFTYENCTCSVPKLTPFVLAATATIGPRPNDVGGDKVKEGTGSAGAVHLIKVEDWYVAGTLSFPKRHVRDGLRAKFVPDRSTTVPPSAAPMLGAAPVTWGSSS